jgi:predicted GNAT family acetyltransferase
MDAIPITREDGDGGGRYVSVVDGIESEMTFESVRRDGRMLMIIDHTGVPKALSGRGVGLALVKRAVEDARAEGFSILPLCSFVRAQMARHPEWRDVLAE